MVKIYKALEKYETKDVSPHTEPFVEPNTAVNNEPEVDVPSPAPPTKIKKINNLDKNLVVHHEPMSYAAEQFRILRTQLMFPRNGPSPRTIMVTSAMQGEGKSFTASNLAVCMAQSINHHVLLIDCDMRRSSLGRIFGFGKVPGLSDYLAEKHTVDEILLKTPIDKLTLLPGGFLPTNPAELLSSRRMTDLLQELKERYSDRLIIIDTPPPQLAADANALTGQVDGILFVLRHFKSNRKHVERVVEKLGKENIIGLMLNYYDAPLQKLGGYGYGYGYYYGENNPKKNKRR